MTDCELSTLVAELEKAEAGSRELDMRIWRLDHAHVRFSTAWERESAPGHYTTSIDAALTLKPDEYYLFEAEENIKGGGWMFLFRRREYGEPETDAEGIARTPALALCIAALKAREAGR